MEKEEKSVRPDSRPSSYYENMTQNETENKRSSNNNMKDCKFSESLSQLHCLNTTVPQKIARENIGGKHTPTRNSLRHSRMIVLNRSVQDTSSNIPLFLKYSTLVKSILIFTVLLGFSLCITSLSLHLWAPNLESRDYWSALPVVISGVIGVLFVHICPKVYDRRVTFCIRSVKYISIAASALAAAASLIIFLLSLIYIITLFSMECISSNNITCVCQYKSTNETTSSYHYVDLSCYEVKHVLGGVTLYTCVANMFITILKLVYLYLHWTCRNVYVYTRVPINENTPVIDNTNR